MDTGRIKKEMRLKSNTEIQKLTYEEVLELYKGYIIKMARKFQKSATENENFDDSYIIGLKGLYTAFDRYDISKNVAFTTFVIPVVTREYLQEARRIRQIRKLRVISLDALMDTSEDSQQRSNACLAQSLLKDTTVNIEKDYELKEVVKDTKETINSMNRVTKEIMTLKLKGLKQKEISDIVGRSQSTVAKNIEKGTRILKREVLGEEKKSMTDVKNRMHEAMKDLIHNSKEKLKLGCTEREVRDELRHTWITDDVRKDGDAPAVNTKIGYIVRKAVEQLQQEQGISSSDSRKDAVEAKLEPYNAIIPKDIEDITENEINKSQIILRNDVAPKKPEEKPIETVTATKKVTNSITVESYDMTIRGVLNSYGCTEKGIEVINRIPLHEISDTCRELEEVKKKLEVLK